MKTKIKPLFGTALSLLVTIGLTRSAEAQDRIVYYAPAIETHISQEDQSIYYTTNNQIFSMEADGSDVRQLTTGTESCFFPSWSPDKTHILFFRGGTLNVMDKDGGGTFAVATAYNVGADWSPDGSKICYVAHSPHPPGPLGLFIVSVDPSAKRKKVGRPVCVSTGDFYGPAWSHDGTKIAFSDQLEPGGGAYLRILDLATGVKSTLGSMPHSVAPSWSPTDEFIAFVSAANTTFWQLFIMNADFSGITQVTSYDKSVLWPTWSADGLQVAFRLGEGGTWDRASLYKLDLATGELTLLQDKGDHADWNP